MRLAIDLRSLIETSGKISGVENYALNLVNSFGGAQRDAGFDVFAFYNAYKPVHFPKEFGGGVEVRSSAIPNRILNASLLLANRPKFESLYGDFDVLWMPDLRPFAIRAKTKLALTVHDLSPVVHPEFYSLKRKLWHALINYRRSFARADIIFAVSEYTKYDLQKLFGVDPKKIAVVYPGINHELFHTNLDQRLKHKIREKYNLPEQYLLAISTIEPRKNILGLISAFETFRAGVMPAGAEDAHLVIAGRLGWLYRDIIRRIEVSPQRDRIHVLGYVEEHDKPYLISQASAVCYPSLYEGFGFQPLEAMACGVPVITSARTSMPEICGDAALLIEPYNQTDLAYALGQVLGDEKLRARLIAKGLQRSREFSWQRAAREIRQALSALV